MRTRQLVWAVIILVVVGLAGAGLWWWLLPRDRPAGTEPPPSLTGPGGAQRYLPPAKRVTDQPIDDATDVARIKPRMNAVKGSESSEELPEIDADRLHRSNNANTSLTQTADTSEPPVPSQADRKAGTPSGKRRLAVIPFKLMGPISEHDKDAGKIIANLLLSEIDSDQFELYERSRLKDLLNEQKLAYSDLLERNSLAVRFGKLAGIRYLVLGSLRRLGFEFHLSARVVDCQSGPIGARGWVSFQLLSHAPQKVPELVNLLSLRHG